MENPFLSRAAESISEESPDARMVRYNYAYALVLSNKFAEAAEQLDAVVKDNSRDPEAVFLLAKAQEKAGQSDAATANDNRARQPARNAGGRVCQTPRHRPPSQYLPVRSRPRRQRAHPPTRPPRRGRPPNDRLATVH